MRENPLPNRNLHLSSSSCFSTSPIIWPTLCKALILSSVWSNSFCKPLMSRRRAFSFASHSRDSNSFALKVSRACRRSSSIPCVDLANLGACGNPSDLFLTLGRKAEGLGFNKGSFYAALRPEPH